MFEIDISKLENSLEPPWVELGLDKLTYLKDLTVRWQSITVLLRSGSLESSVVRSTVTDTVKFLAWAKSKHELQATAALLRSYMTRIKDAYDNQSLSKGVDPRG